jgi:predicted MFS family arabinose efflux permease
MFAVAWSGAIATWHLAAMAFAGGLFWTTDLPARRTMMGTIAGVDRVAAAMALDSATSNGTRALGPALGGLALATIGLQGALAVSVVGYALSLLLILRVPEVAAGALGGRLQGVWRGIAVGLRYAAGNREMAGALAVTIIFNVWGFPYTAMIPVIGRDVLGLGPFPVGLIMSAEGTGAFLGALYLATAARVHLYRRYYFGGQLACLVMILALSASGGIVSAGLAVLVAGIGAGFFATMQATLIFTLAPPEIRSRLMGVLTVCIGTAPLGFAHVGLLADWLGPAPALAIIAVEGLLASLAAWLYWPEIR